MSDPRFTLVDPNGHKDFRVNTLLADCPHNHVNVAAVVANELSTLCHEYPIFVTRNPNTSQYQLSAILGLKSGQNLYLQDGKWNSDYIPMDIARRPFQLFASDETNQHGHLTIDMTSPQVQQEVGERLFEEDGSPSEYMQRIHKTFSSLMGNAQLTNNIMKLAEELDLIESLDMTFEFQSGDVSLNGVYGFSGEKISQLAGENLQKAHEQGVLQVAHLVMSSAVNLNKLTRWYGRLA